METSLSFLFDIWNALKKKMNREENVPFFKERDIFFIKMGKNIGHEQDGKGDSFRRPVIILKKFNDRLFWGIPLSSQEKNGKYYYKFSFHNKQQRALLSQLRLFDASRIMDKIGMINERDFKNVKEKIKGLL